MFRNFFGLSVISLSFPIGKTAFKIFDGLEFLRINATDIYIEKVCKSISDSAKNDFEKVKMIHDFVTVLIHHGNPLIHGNVFHQDYYTILKNRVPVATSDGFANVFKGFCDKLGFPCKKVHGYKRRMHWGNSILNEQEPIIPNHTWNIVEIYKAWYIVDCTWDSYYGSPIVTRQTTDITKIPPYIEERKIYPYINENYSTELLFPKAEDFIYTHFPSNPEYQLIPHKISAEEFIKLPCLLRPEFFQVSNSFDSLEKINNVENSFSLSLSSYNDYSAFDITVTNTETKTDIKNCVFIKSINNKKEIQFSFPTAGIYRINISYFRSKFETAIQCGEFFVNAKSSNSIRYPTFWLSFVKNFDIMSPSPIEEPLKKGQSYTFKIHIENTNFVFATDDETSFPLKNEGNGIFTLDITIPTTADKLDLVYETYNKEYEALVTYKVE